MQVLNSQRKAFLDMLAWSEGTDNGRQPTRNHGYDVIVGGELFTDYSEHAAFRCQRPEFFDVVNRGTAGINGNG
jgi:muramidase (phage lysozyme)